MATTYATEDQIKSAARAIAVELTSDQIAASQPWADSRIDARLSLVYAVPFKRPIPRIIQQISADLAAYKAITEAYFAGGENTVPVAAKELFDRAEKMLLELANGQSGIPVSELGSSYAPPPPNFATSATPGRVPILRQFDLVNVPNTTQPPFAPRRGWSGRLRPRNDDFC